jgi:hypothetical protein
MWHEAGRLFGVPGPLLDLIGELAVTTGTQLTRMVVVVPAVDALLHGTDTFRTVLGAGVR